jgi:hypothetical protein
MELKKVFAKVQKLARRFQNDVTSFYDAKALKDGCILAKDREGRHVCFPLLTVSAVILELPTPRSVVCSVEEIGKNMADQKKTAKNNSDKLCVVRITDSNELVMIPNESLTMEDAYPAPLGNNTAAPAYSVQPFNLA